MCLGSVLFYLFLYFLPVLGKVVFLCQGNFSYGSGGYAYFGVVGQSEDERRAAGWVVLH